MEKPVMIEVVGKSATLPHHRVANGHDRYFYDVIVDGKKQILSVGSKMNKVILENWPDLKQFIIVNQELFPVAVDCTLQSGKS